MTNSARFIAVIEQGAAGRKSIGSPRLYLGLSACHLGPTVAGRQNLPTKDFMIVRFCKGLLEREPGQEVTAAWAVTPFGIIAVTAGANPELLAVRPEQVIATEPVTSLDLPGLDQEGMEAIVMNILRGRYLEKPGIEDKGEAILFVLVNEAIHELERLRENEEID